MRALPGQRQGQLENFFRNFPDRKVTAEELGKNIGCSEVAAGSALSSAFYDGFLDREAAQGGTLYFVHKGPPLQPGERVRPGYKRRKGSKAAPQVQAAPPSDLVKFNIKGIEMSEKEAFEVYRALSRIFDRVTTPAS